MLDYYDSDSLNASPFPIPDVADPQQCQSDFPLVGGEVNYMEYKHMKELTRGGNNPVYGQSGLDTYPQIVGCGDAPIAAAEHGLHAASECNAPVQYGTGCMNPNCNCPDCQGDCLCGGANGAGGSGSVVKEKFGMNTLQGAVQDLQDLNFMCIIKWMLIILLACLVLVLVCNNMNFGSGGFDLGGYMGEPLPFEEVSTFVDLSELF